jgi:hypothetical protein
MNFITQRHLSRRALLKQGSIALALPWLESMQSAFAATPVQPKRFVCVLNYFSFHAPNFFPKEAGAAYTPSPYLDLIKEHRDDFTVISGLNHPEVRDGHNSDKSFLTGTPHPGSPSFRNGISLDQLIAEKIGSQTRFASIAMAQGSGTSFSYSRSGVAIPAESSVTRMFAKLFINGTPAEVQTEVERVRQGRSILDRVGAEARAMQRDVGAADREKLDQYFTSVRELEQRMVTAEDYARRPKPNPGIAPLKDPAPGEQTLSFGLNLQLAQLAFQADLTRLATIYYIGTTKTPSKPGESFAYHDLSHHGQDSGKINKLTLLERDIMSECGKFLGRLKTPDESGTRLIDNTITVVGAGMGNASSHDATNLPILIAGGGFKHGQHTPHDPKNPPPLCNLWVQIAHRMGVEVDKFGSSNKETLAGLETV